LLATTPCTSIPEKVHVQCQVRGIEFLGLKSAELERNQTYCVVRTRTGSGVGADAQINVNISGIQRKSAGPSRPDQAVQQDREHDGRDDHI
jgi:hypothetical protein